MNKYLEKAIRQPSRLEILIAYMQDTTDSIRLRPEDEEVLDRYRAMDTTIAKFKTRAACMRFHMKKYPGISEATARNDYYDTKKLFNSENRASKHYDRELINQSLWHTYKLAMKAQDFKAAATCLKELSRVNSKQLDEDMQLELEAPAVLVSEDNPKLLGREPVPVDELEKLIRKWQKSKKDVNINFDDAEEVS
jgi:hypothetical protein